MEELAGTCLKYADPPAAAAPAQQSPPVSADEQAERTLGLGLAERRQVQSGLQAAGHYTGPIDGSIGPASRRAIAAWQRAEGAPATGFLTAAQARRLTAIAVTGGGAAPSPPLPASESRDRRRAAALVGASCYFTAFGTPFDMKFYSGGRAIASYLEGEARIDWRVEGDRLCLFGDMVRNETCADLPLSEDRERAMLEAKAREVCNTFQMRRPPGQL